jgi:hypothetical protein
MFKLTLELKLACEDGLPDVLAEHRQVAVESAAVAHRQLGEETFSLQAQRVPLRDYRLKPSSK